MMDNVYDVADFREADFIRAIKWLVKDGDESEPILIPRVTFNRICDLSIKYLETNAAKKDTPS